MTIRGRDMWKRRAMVLMLGVAGLLAGWLSYSALSSGEDVVAGWCVRYEGSLQAVDELSGLETTDTGYEAAIIAAQTAVNALAQADRPEGIAQEAATLEAGYQPGVEGQSRSELNEASTRMLAWAAEHCDLDGALVERTQGPFDR